MLAKPVVIVVRTDMKWSGQKELHTQSLKMKPAGHIRYVRSRPVMDFWNRHFSIPFHQFRHEIQAIAQDNLKEVSNAKIYMGVPRLLRDLLMLHPRSIVVPIDDDDWLSPRLTSLLLEPTTPGVKWAFSTLYGSVFTLHHQRRILTMTNNYGVRVGWLRRCPDRRRNMLLSKHWTAGPLIRSIGVQSARCGLNVKHPGAATQLRKLVNKFGNQPQGMKEYLAGILEAHPIPDCFAWCEPYYERLLDLYREAIR